MQDLKGQANNSEFQKRINQALKKAFKVRRNRPERHRLGIRAG